MAAGDGTRDPLIHDYQLVAVIAGMLRSASIAGQIDGSPPPEKYLADAEKLVRMARERIEPTEQRVDDDAPQMHYTYRVPGYAMVRPASAVKEMSATINPHKAYWAQEDQRKGVIRFDGSFTIADTPNGVIPPDATHVVLF